MASLPPLLPTPPATLKLRDTDAVESRAPKRHRPLEPPPRTEYLGSHREPSPPPSSRRRTGGTPPPPPSNVRRRSRSPPYVPSTQRLTERRHVKRPSAEAAVEGEMSRPSSLDDSLLENRPSHSNRNCEHPETSSAAVEKRPDPAIRGDEQKLDCEKMDRKNESNDKAPSRSARRKKLKRQIKAEAKKEMREQPETSSPAVEKRPDPAITGDEQKLDCEKMDKKNQSDYKAPCRSSRRKKMKRQARKEIREMKKDRLLENIKKLQSCIWLLEKDGADMAEIMEFRSMLESTKKQYAETEARLAKEGSSAPRQVLIRDRLEKTVVSERNESAEEVNRLKTELEKVRQDRDYQLAQAQSLMADVAKQKEVARRYGIELEDTMKRVAALEEGCLSRRETIKALQIQLASANETLTVPSPARD